MVDIPDIGSMMGGISPAILALVGIMVVLVIVAFGLMMLIPIVNRSNRIPYKIDFNGRNLGGLIKHTPYSCLILMQRGGSVVDVWEKWGYINLQGEPAAYYKFLNWTSAVPSYTSLMPGKFFIGRSQEENIILPYNVTDVLDMKLISKGALAHLMNRLRAIDDATASQSPWEKYLPYIAIMTTGMICAALVFITVYLLTDKMSGVASTCSAGINAAHTVVSAPPPA